VARSSNGIDVAAVYQLLTEVAKTAQLHGDALGEIHRELGDVRVSVDDLQASVADLREAVRNYHTTVVGHGVLYGELEQRIRRIERHLKLETTGE
jgi:hypothetical protein